jgi:hypothetical protein
MNNPLPLPSGKDLIVSYRHFGTPFAALLLLYLIIIINWLTICSETF